MCLQLLEQEEADLRRELIERWKASKNGLDRSRSNRQHPTASDCSELGCRVAGRTAMENREKTTRGRHQMESLGNAAITIDLLTRVNWRIVVHGPN